MKSVVHKTGLCLSALLLIGGCVSTNAPSQTSTQSQLSIAKPPVANTPLTLKQIMANPDWMGLTANGAYWSDDSSAILFSRKASNAAVSQHYRQNINETSAQELTLAELHQVSQRTGVFNQTRTVKAYIYHGNVFIKQLSTGKITQLTRQNIAVENVRFLNNGNLAYWYQGQVFQYHFGTGMIEQLADINMQAAPKEVEEPSDYLSKKRHELIQYVAKQYTNKKEEATYKQQLQIADPTLTAKPWYLGDENAIVELSLSPSGRYILLALRDSKYTWRQPHDIMSNYLDPKGYVDAVPVRSRIAEDNVPEQQLVLLDLQQHQKTVVSYAGLTGINEDVLADVKAENSKLMGDAYKAQSSKRKIQLMQDWGWGQSAMQWQANNDALLIMLEAIDNKDRWITTLDLNSGNLTTEHRLHDNAWINYTHNQFGWLPDNQSFYYLSEESGYAQLYKKTIGGSTQALTTGNYVVSDVTLSPDGNYIYYKANKAHPGKYNVYRTVLKTGNNEQLTQWNGVLDYQLSPDQQSLLLSASSLLQPTELFVKPIGGQRKQLTHYTSAAFKSYPWQAPQIIAVPSTHGASDIYARLYLSKDFDANNADKYPAVIFNHGAGYLQEAHYGFSGYFREFMFNNMLAQQGYVVLDMDYRGSKGYGRDWRTAIYRNMGHPEVEDLEDGITWLALNTNVDPQRVGTYGGSYGGFLTFMSLFTQPDMFQSGAALRPVANWANYNAPYTSNILNTPDIDPIAYERSSPIFHAQGLTKPLLIMSGVMDDNVFFQDSVVMVQRLIELEKSTFEMAIYPVEPHGFKQPSSWLDEYRRIYQLFEETLK